MTVAPAAVRAGIAALLEPLSPHVARVHATTPANVYPPCVVVGMPSIEFRNLTACFDQYDAQIAVVLSNPMGGEQRAQHDMDEFLSTVVGLLQTDDPPDPLAAMRVERADFGAFTAGSGQEFPAYTIRLEIHA